MKLHREPNKSKVISSFFIIFAVIFLINWLITIISFGRINSELKMNIKVAGIGGIDYTSPETSLSPFKISKSKKSVLDANNEIKKALLEQREVAVLEIHKLDNEITQFKNRYEKLRSKYLIEEEFRDNFNILEVDFNNIEMKEIFEVKNERVAKLSEVTLVIEKFINTNKEDDNFYNPLWNKTNDGLEDMVKEMSLQEKVAQMFIVGVSGTKLAENAKEVLQKTKPGGVIIMGENISTEEQLKKFNKDLLNTNPEIPMFISVDQEGGVVSRLYWDSTSGQTKWNELNEEEICKEAKDRSKTLSNVYINLNFAPVVDLSNSNPAFINNRTISSDPDIVSQKAKSYIECFKNFGVYSTLKHFPGHGATVEDSHITLPKVSMSKQEWLNSDAIPFIGNTDTELIMVGHLLFTDLDPEEPATQSPIVINDLLRNELGYKGVLITDDMNQLHTSTGISVEEALTKVFNSGIDIALYVGKPKTEEELVQIVIDLIDSGELAEEKIDESVGRILELKREII